MKLKLMTYNIMSCKSYPEFKAGRIPAAENPSLAATVILEHGADIVCVNEVHDGGASWDNQPSRIAKEAGYEYFYFAQSIITAGNSPYGNVVLSKYPILWAETIALPAGNPLDEKSCEARSIAKVVIDLDGKKVMVLASHFGLAPSEKQAALDAVKKLVAKSEYPCILMGDFNMEPHEKLIKELKSLLKDTAPEEIDKSWYTFASDDPYMKIDYIFVDKSITVKRAEVIEAEPSDHKPYIAEITL